MTRTNLYRVAMVSSLAASALALAVVLANVVSGVVPQVDESTSAHVWQLLMAAQLPLVAITVATADLRRRWTGPLLALQVTAILAACVPVWVAGY